MVVEIAYSSKAGYSITFIPDQQDGAADFDGEFTLCERAYTSGCHSCGEVAFTVCDGGCVYGNRVSFRGSSSLLFDYEKLQQLVNSAVEGVPLDDRAGFLVAILELAGKVCDLGVEDE